MNNKILLAALSQDLYRAALGWHSGSTLVADRFSQEALSTADKIDKESIKPYIARILSKLPKVLSEVDTQRRAEDVLTYSILIQNAALSQ